MQLTFRTGTILRVFSEKETTRDQEDLPEIRKADTSA